MIHIDDAQREDFKKLECLWEQLGADDFAEHLKLYFVNNMDHSYTSKTIIEIINEELAKYLMGEKKHE